MVLLKNRRSRPRYYPDVVEDYGAGENRSGLENYRAFRDATEQNSRVDIPANQYDLTETIVIEKRTGVNLKGTPGSVAAGTRTGSHFWWKGAAGGWSMIFNEVNSCVVEGLGFFSNQSVNGAFTDKGVLISNDENEITSSNIRFMFCNWARLAVGIQAGRTGLNQSTNSEVLLFCPDFTSCGDGILFQGDQAANWRIFHMTGLSCGNVVRCGEFGSFNRGNFTVFGAALGNNTYDFNLPSFGYSSELYRVTSEGALAFIQTDPDGGDAYYRLLLDSCKATPRVGGKAIVFRQNADLIARNCWFAGTVEIGNKFGASASSAPPALADDVPIRQFDRCWMPRPTLVDTTKRYNWDVRPTHWGNQAVWGNYAHVFGNQSGQVYALNWAGERVYSEDTFTRADSASTMGSAESGQAWTPSSGTWGVASNKAYSASDADDDLTLLESSVANARLSCTISGNLHTFGNGRFPQLVFRAVDASNFLYVDMAVGNVRLWKRVAGTFTMITQAATTTTSGQDYAITVDYNGALVLVYVDGIWKFTSVLTGTEYAGVLSATKVGLHIFKAGSPANVARFDNFLVVKP